MSCYIALYSGSIYTASGLSLQVSVPAGMIGVRMGIVDRFQLPSASVEYLTHFSARILVAAAVYETYVSVVKLHQPYFGRALYVM